MTNTAPVPIEASDAESLDKKLRAQARATVDGIERLKEIIAKAKAGQIHVALGFKSWPDYIADVVSKEMPNVARSVEQRRTVVEILAGEGMSQRAIADAVGASQSTVRDDVAQVSGNYSPEPAELESPQPVTDRSRPP